MITSYQNPNKAKVEIGIVVWYYRSTLLIFYYGRYVMKLWELTGIICGS